jgi:hypothetical protein
MAVLTEAIEAAREAGAGRVSDDARVATVTTTALAVTSTVAQDVPALARAHHTMIVTTVPPVESVKKSDVPDGIVRVVVAAAQAAAAQANHPN